MAAPTPYVPQYNFTNFQTANPSTPLPANSLDAELFDIKITTDQLIANLSQIQRSDTALQNACVTPDSLNPAVLILMGNFNPRGNWVTLTVYAARDVVSQASGTYVCNTAHTSGVFATDLAAGKWTLIAGTSGTVALSTCTDVTITTPVSNNLLSYNGTKWVNTNLALANIADGLITFVKLNAAVFSTDGTFASANNTTFPTTQAVKTFVQSSGAAATGADVVAASTTNISGSFDYLRVTGNTTINAITLNANESKWVRFTGTPLLKNNATSLILPGGADIQAAANDRALFRGLDGTNVLCQTYIKANGQAIVVPSSGIVSVKTQKIATSGTYTPSAGMVYCVAEAVGGGGGGGDFGTNVGAGGGGGGGYARALLTAVQVGVSQVATIGGGGAHNSGSGGTTSLGSLLVATGGGGGTSGGGGTAGLPGGLGGNGSTGDITTYGTDGGTSPPAASAVGVGGNGGASYLGGGGGGGLAANNGNPGNNYGGGGGGSGCGSSHIGGAGAPGVIFITEYCSQ